MRLDAILAAALLATPPAPSDEALLGFTPASSAAQRQRERRYDGLLKADNLREWMKRLAARPHAVGSAQGLENARFLRAQLESWGYEARIEEFEVLFPTPRERLLEMVAPRRFRASLAEPALPGDPTSGQTAEQLPTYNAYSIDGDVSGELVYVNYGLPDDYEELAQRGIDVKGRIVIARYGASWRGIKPKVAAERGAVGCLIYSDPRDDGFFQGDVYPEGPWRSEHGAQRGSVADMPLFPGDPLTPGVGATPGAKRLALSEAPTLTRIPVLPISHADALPLLKALAGPAAPERWRGALPITYHLGPGPARVRLKLAFDWKRAVAHDVIALLRGRERPEQWILRGNHHDAWVNGAYDPVSGMVAVLEEARALGELHKAGWSPRRTIVYAAWDAEEPGLLGSTEWAEAHAAELRERAAVYVNSDSNGRGFLDAAGSHSLERFLNQVMADVKDPQKGVSVQERLRARRIARGTAEERRQTRDRPDLRIGALGSGSDYTPFLQHLGIASLDLGFGGESGGGSYHSIYDSVSHYQRFGDPSFAYGVALAQVGGRVTLRLSEAEVLPFQFGPLAETVGRYADEVFRLADELRDQGEEHNRLLRDRTLELSADPSLPFVPPPPRDAVPHFNFAPLRNARQRLEESGHRYDRALISRLAAPEGIPPETQRALDALLVQAERVLTSDQGLPGRPWFRHLVYAPGFYTGYGVKTLPGVRESLERRTWTAVEEQAAVVSAALERLAAHLDRATALLEPPATPD
jgi:N-acetylated-alpha-linked acidic dipeptidase